MLLALALPSFAGLTEGDGDSLLLRLACLYFSLDVGRDYPLRSTLP